MACLIIALVRKGRMKTKNILKVETPNDFAQREMTIETDTVTNVALMIRVVNVSLRPLFIRDAKVRNNLVIRHKTLQNIPDIWWSRQKSVPLRSIWK